MNKEFDKKYKKARQRAGKCPICFKDLALKKDELLKTLGLDKPTENNTPITAEDVKQGFKEMAKTYHPDKETGNPEKFQEIKEAKEELLEMIEEDPLSITPVGEALQQQTPQPPPAHLDIVQLYNMKQAIGRLRATHKPGQPCPFCRQR